MFVCKQPSQAPAAECAHTWCIWPDWVIVHCGQLPAASAEGQNPLGMHTEIMPETASALDHIWEVSQYTY